MRRYFGVVVVAILLAANIAFAGAQDAPIQAGVLTPSAARVAERASGAVIAVQAQERRQAELTGVAELLPLLNELRRGLEPTTRRPAMAGYLPRLLDEDLRATTAPAAADQDEIQQQLARLAEKRLELEARIDLADISRQARIARRALGHVAALEAATASALDLPEPQRASALAELQQQLVVTKHGFERPVDPALRKPTLRLVPQADLPKPARTLRHELPEDSGRP
jgi:hypothetical protein